MESWRNCGEPVDGVALWGEVVMELVENGARKLVYLESEVQI